MAQRPERLHVEGAIRILSDGQRRAHIEIAELCLLAGSCYALCGPSGIGKTTALEMVSLARAPDGVAASRLRSRDGAVLDLADPDLGAGERTRLRGLHFGYVVQTNRLFPYLSVRENVLLPQRLSGTLDHDFADALLDALDLADLSEVRPQLLSGGQRQRVCVARAMAHKPAILLADEPTSSVDQELARAIMDLITWYADAHDAAVLIVTHNEQMVSDAGLLRLSVKSTSANGRLKTLISQEARPGRSQGDRTVDARCV